MASIVSGYENFSYLLGKGLLDLATAPLKVALLDSGYLYSPVTANYAAILSWELTTGNFANYTAGGKAFVNQTFEQEIVSGNNFLNADDITWAGADITCRTAFVYVDAVVSPPAEVPITKPALFSILFDDTPADVTRSDFTIKWSTNGIVYLPVAGT